MDILNTKFLGLKVIKQKNNFDARGFLRETHNQKVIKNRNFVFEYCTTTKARILRGFHFQTKFKQAKYVNVIKGKILDCVIDLRKNSKTFGKSFKIILSEKNCKSVFIPPGFAHGFQSLEKENIVCYSCTEYRSIGNEHALLYNDPFLKIKWPRQKPLITTKDKNAKKFRDFFKF